MKCNNCQYLCYPEYESNYTECQIFGEEPPEEYITEDGCNCTEELLKRILTENEKALEREHEAFVEWFLKAETEVDNG